MPTRKPTAAKSKPKRQPQRSAPRLDKNAAVLKRVRQLVAKLPDTLEKEAWEAPTFRVDGRIFAMYSDNHHNDGRIALWLAAPAGAQAAFISADPERFFKPPYVGPSGWIGIRLEYRPPWGLIADLLEEAHRTIAEKAAGKKRTK